MTKSNRGGRREGAGRPRQFAEFAKFSVSLDAELLDKLDGYCEANETTRSAVIREAIERLTKQRRKSI